MFFYIIGSVSIIALVYVDDIIITGSCLKSIANSQFVVKDLGPMHFFLGIEVHRSPAVLHLSQTKYFRDLLTKIGMLTSKSIPNPISLGTISIHDGTPLSSTTIIEVWLVHYSTVL